MVAKRKPLTIQAFNEFVFLPENADKRLEYVGGEIVEALSNARASRIAAFVAGRLGLFVEDNNLGWLTGADGGYVVAEECYIPDAAFMSKQRQPQPSEEAYNPLAPDLAVEVISHISNHDKPQIKSANYLLGEI